jgi:hypothetical protein
MGKIIVALFWITFAIPVYARQLPGSPPFAGPFGAATNRAAGRGFQFRSQPSLRLLPPGGEAHLHTDQAPQVSGQSPTGSSPSRPPEPHLIELTSANWRPLTHQQKLKLFDRDLLHWETHASLLFDAGIGSATGDREYLGTGARGFFSIYGLNVADEVNFTFFNAYLFPTVFHQDPRYIPLDHGTTRARLFYAVSRVAVTRGDSGKSEFNKSRILGTILATSISSAYYAGCGANVTVGGNFANIGINLGSDAAYDLLKEFWPDAARKLKLSIWIRNLVRAAIRDQIRVG